MTRIVTVVGSLFGALAPAVVAAHPADELQPGEWMVLSLNTIGDVDPCPAQDCSYSAVEGVSGAIDDWCGGALASGHGMLGGLVVWGGGHNGYFGSEIYVFDIESQLWERASEPFDDGSDSVAAACSADGVYPDGSACPTHTYDRVDYHPGTNSFVVLFATPDPVCGGCDDPNVHLFGFDDGAWSLGAAHPMPSPFTGASSAYDAARDSYWLLPAYNGFFSQYDAGADTWTAHQQYNLDIDAVSAIDPGRDLFVTVDGRVTHSVIVHDLANPTNLGTTVTVDGTSPIMESGAQGFEWDPVSSQFVGWGGGPEVWTLVAPEGDWATETWTWLRVDPAPENTVVPTDPNANGTYSRWRHVASLNVFVVVNRVDDPVFAYRLSDDPGVGPNDDGGSETGAGSGSDGGPGTSGGGVDDGVDAGATGPSGDGPGTSEGSSGGAGEDDASGCGCTSGRGNAAPLALVVLAWAARRRRRCAVAVLAGAIGCSDDGEVAQDGGSSSVADASATSTATASSVTSSTTSGADSTDGADESGAATGSVEETGDPGAGGFDQRCAAPGVIACWGFDTPEETDPYLSDSGFSAPAFDATTFAEGAGAVHMLVESGSGPDTSGSFTLDFEPGIGEGEVLYVQWRQRFSQTFLATAFNGPGWKQMLVHENTSTAGCSDSEVVVQSYYSAGFPIVYHACGIFESPVENPVDGDIYEFNYQPGGDNRCLWSWMDMGIDHLEPTRDLDELACVGPLADSWVTFQLAVHLTSWCTDADYASCPTDSRLQLWVTQEGDAPVLVTDWPFALRTTTDPATTVYDSMQFTPYQTDKDPAIAHETGEIWYDSVIVSRERIPEPA